MTTVRQLIIDGFRESGIVETGGVPDGDEFEEGLRKLQSVYTSLFDNELGEPLVTINYGTAGLTESYAKSQDLSSDLRAAYVPSNYRLVFNIDATQSLSLNPRPQDGARLAIIDNGSNFATYPVTLNGNGRKIEGASSVVLNTNGMTREWFYRADLGQWTRVIDLDPNDTSPLPLNFDDMLSTMLAVRLNPRYGAQLDQSTIEVLERGIRKFRARYKQITEQASEDALIRLPSNRFWTYWGGDSSNAFDRGRP